MPDYLVYGLRLRADQPISGFAEVKSAATPDVTVTFDQEVVGDRFATGRWQPHPTLVDQRPTDDPSVVGVTLEQSLDGRYAAIEFGDGARFVLAQDGTEVFVTPPAGMSHDSVCTYLESTVLSLSLRLMGRRGLHASAVDIDGSGVAFVGPGGFGKSTLAYELGRLGFAVLTDDLAVVLNGDPPLVLPGYPRIRLWPWTVEGLLGDEDALPRICADWEKRGAHIEDFDLTPRPLAAVIVLGGFGDSIEIERLRPARAVVEMMENASLSCLIDPDTRRADFEFFGDLVATVPVFQLRRPRDLGATDKSALAVVDMLRSGEAA